MGECLNLVNNHTICLNNCFRREEAVKDILALSGLLVCYETEAGRIFVEGVVQFIVWRHQRSITPLDVCAYTFVPSVLIVIYIEVCLRVAKV